MKWVLLPCGLALAGWLASQQVLDDRERIEQLESRLSEAPEALQRLAAENRELRFELGELLARLESDQSRRELVERLLALERQLTDADSRLDDQRQRLLTWEDLWQGFEPTIDSRLEALTQAIDQRWHALDTRSTNAQEQLLADRQRLDRLDQRVTLRDDHARMWDELVGPVVQLAGESTVGSGVLLESKPTDQADVWVTHMLTAWHVVRDIYGPEGDLKGPLPVKIYRRDGGLEFETARLLAHDSALDLALLSLDCGRRLACGAKLPTRERLAAIETFAPIYAVGCPLGNDPIPTPGEVASIAHEVDGVMYWMTSAATYIGNSGGGIFDADTHELLAIFSKIYTHGSLRSTIVPHMGLSTPMTTVYDWLGRQGYAVLEPGALTGAAKTASVELERPTEGR